jgi:hypothetical protein
MTVSNQEFCAWDVSGDDCTGDIGNPLFYIHNGRFFVVGLRSYVETDEVRNLIESVVSFHLLDRFFISLSRISLSLPNIQPSTLESDRC